MAFWTACIFQASVDDEVDQFCGMFNQEAVEQLNYLADLGTYYVRGYGHPLDYTIACPLLTDFMDAIDNIVKSPNDDHSERANLRFAHAETIMPLVAYVHTHTHTHTHAPRSGCWGCMMMPLP